jgi:16S rRNA (uracil1498-N3)-methyltransferase
MKRFFVEEISAESEFADIKGDELRHLRGVLRLTKGAEVSLFNGKGLELTGVVESFGRGSARVRVEGEKVSASESPLAITLLQGLVKGDKPEFVVQKATELGVKEVIFYTTLRTVPVIDGERVGKKLARLKRVSVEAAKQCGRSHLPGIDITDFKRAVRDRPGRLKLLLEKGSVINRMVLEHAPLNEALRSTAVEGHRPGGGVVLLVGPEGGLSEKEVAGAVKQGFRPVSLGPRTLRAETAAVAALSIIQYELGDMNG